ncbi:hypothetical protein YC2023_007707 [Brassica napus]|uniref:Uncharacterized protein n=2 Tax=Brassica TaxID=3705 RepID=A0A3P6FMU4_BRAOL|nr:unnamed protein product [Brassica napus]VDD48351.1 unnamed protein product [Brassica oleracea]
MLVFKHFDIASSVRAVLTEPERPSSGKPENSSKERGELRLLFDVSVWDISVVVIEDKPFPPLPQLENLMRLLPLFTDL